MSGQGWVFGDRRRRRPSREERDEAREDESGDWIVVEYAPIRCPRCGGTAKHVKRVNGGVRYHRCEDEECGLPFKSIERSVRVVFCPSRMLRFLRSGDGR